MLTLKIGTLKLMRLFVKNVNKPKHHLKKIINILLNMYWILKEIYQNKSSEQRSLCHVKVNSVSSNETVQNKSRKEIPKEYILKFWICLKIFYFKMHYFIFLLWTNNSNFTILIKIWIFFFFCFFLLTSNLKRVDIIGYYFRMSHNIKALSES